MTETAAPRPFDAHTQLLDDSDDEDEENDSENGEHEDGKQGGGNNNNNNNYSGAALNVNSEPLALPGDDRAAAADAADGGRAGTVKAVQHADSGDAGGNRAAKFAKEVSGGEDADGADTGRKAPAGRQLLASATTALGSGRRDGGGGGGSSVMAGDESASEVRPGRGGRGGLPDCSARGVCVGLRRGAGSSSARVNRR